jgi:hypothetical protein
MKRSLIVIAAYALLALTATHPLWQHLGDALPGDVGDPVLNTYILAWDAHALVVDPLHLFDANIFYPLPNTLAFSENLSGDALLALPLMLLSGEPVLTYNLVFLSSFVLAGYGMYLLVLRMTGSRGAAFAAGAAFAFAPYRIASLAHVQLLTVGWLPLLVLALSGILRTAHSVLRNNQTLQHADLAVSVADQSLHSTQYAVRSTPYAVVFVFLWMQIASTLQGALFAALSVLVFGIIHVRWLAASCRAHGGARWRELIVPLAVFVCLLLPLVLPYLAVLNDLRASRPPSVAMSFSARPSDYLAAYPDNRLFGALTRIFRARDGFSEEQTLFMGVIAPLLAIVALAGVWRQRTELMAWTVFFAMLAFAALLLASSGPLAQALPLASVMRVPARWSGVLTFALAGLGGIGAALILKRVTQVLSSYPSPCARALARPAHPLSVLRTPGQGPVRGQVGRAQGIPQPLSLKRRGEQKLPLPVGERVGVRGDTAGNMAFERFVKGLLNGRTGGAGPLAGVTILAALLFAEGFAAPIAIADVGSLRAQPTVYQYLAQLPGREAVIELPMYTGTKRESAESKRMYASVLHWRPLVNGYSGFTPERQVALADQLKDFPDDNSMAALRALGKQGVRYVIVHAGEQGIPRREWNQTNRARALDSGVLKLVMTFDDNDLMEIVGP